MSIMIDLPDEIEASLRAKAEAQKQPPALFITNVLKWYIAAPARTLSDAAIPYSEADDAAVAEGIAAVEAGRVRSVKDAFADFAERHNMSGAKLD